MHPAGISWLLVIILLSLSVQTLAMDKFELGRLTSAHHDVIYYVDTISSKKGLIPQQVTIRNQVSLVAIVRRKGNDEAHPGRPFTIPAAVTSNRSMHAQLQSQVMMTTMSEVSNKQQVQTQINQYQKVMVHVNVSDLNADFIRQHLNFFPRQVFWHFHTSNTTAFSQLHQQFRLTDQIYIFNSNLINSSIIEVFGIKGQTIMRKILDTDSCTSELARRMNLGTRLEVAHVNHPAVLTTSGTETMHFYWGEEDLSYRFLAFMQDALNFSVQFHRTSTWVYANSNTTSSMADLLSNRTVDLALSSTGLWAISNFSFLFVTRVHKEIYIYFHMTQLPVYGNLFRDIFSLEASAAVLSAVLAIFILSIFFFNQSHLDELFLWTFSIVSQKGVEEEPKSSHKISARIYFLAVSIFAVLFYASTSAFLLTKFALEGGIYQLKDLVDRKYTFGVWENSLIDNGFKLGYYKTTSPLWSIKNIYKTFTNQPEGIEAVLRTKGFAYISLQNVFMEHSDELGNLNLDKNCEKLKQLVIYGDKRWGSAFVLPDSEFRNHFNYVRTLMFQVGIVNRHLKTIQSQEDSAQPNCYTHTKSVSEEDTISSVKKHAIYFQEIRLVFYIFMGGIGFSILVLGTEVIIVKVQMLEIN